MTQQPVLDPVTERRMRAKALLDFLQAKSNEWVSVRSLTSYKEFGGKEVGSVISYLSRREPVFVRTDYEGKRKIKMVRYSPPPPDQCKYCRGRGCLICGKAIVVADELA